MQTVKITSRRGSIPIAKITSAGFSLPVGATVTDAEGRTWQITTKAGDAIPYVKPPPQRRFYAGSKGQPNRRILYSNRHGTYHATKGWRR